jgi:type IV pilus assembly protein PilM
MARSCGIRIGPRRFELVVLDGSPKRHKISAYYAGEFTAEETTAYLSGDVSKVAEVLKEAAATHRVPRENISAILPADHAAYRRITLPFADRDKIDKVIKFEVENELPQFDIEDVVVDYHVMSENEQGAELLVSAVPKDCVGRAVEALEKAGLEPLEAELESSAMVNSALAADISHIDDAQLLVHVGEHSTCVAVVAGAELREMRVIHIGAMSHLGAELAAVAAEDTKSEAADGEAAADQEADASTAPDALDPIEMNRRIDQAIKRIRREIGRTISAARTAQPIEAIYACGMELPGLIGSTVLDVPVYVLDCFEEDSGQPSEGSGQLVAAYGGAFRQLGGGVMTPSLRKEELSYSGAWERLEFPVAFAALMLTTFLGMVNIVQIRKIDALNYTGILQYLRNVNAFIVGSDASRGPAILNPVPKDLVVRAKVYEQEVEFGGDVQEPLDELETIEQMINKKVLDLKREVGDIQEVPLPPSAFTAMTCVLGVMNGNDDWRPSLRALKADYVKKNKDLPEHTKIRLDATFFSDSVPEASNDITAFDAALREQPWCLEVEQATLTPTEGDTGLNFRGKVILVDPSKLFSSRAD